MRIILCAGYETIKTMKTIKTTLSWIAYLFMQSCGVLLPQPAAQYQLHIMHSVLSVLSVPVCSKCDLTYISVNSERFALIRSVSETGPAGSMMSSVHTLFTCTYCCILRAHM
jgi:hypothetical protein